MIYEIGGKFYLKVQGYYKEIDIKVNGDNLEITPNGNEIEVCNAKTFEMYDTRTNKNNLIQKLKSNENRNRRIFDEDTSFEEQNIKNRRRRM